MIKEDNQNINDELFINERIESIKQHIKSINKQLTQVSNDNLQKNLYLAAQIDMICCAMDKIGHAIRFTYPETSEGKEALDEIQKKLFIRIFEMINNI
jgi:hypothetical protein